MPPGFFKRLWVAVELLVLFVWEVLWANLRLARDILGPRDALNPGWVDLPVRELSPRQAWILAACITMTPGTLALRWDRAAGVLSLHLLHLEEAGAVGALIRTRFERRICDVF